MIRAGKSSGWTGAILSVLVGGVAAFLDAAARRYWGGYPPIALGYLAVTSVAILLGPLDTLLGALAVAAIVGVELVVGPVSLTGWIALGVFAIVSCGMSWIVEMVERSANAAADAERTLEQVEGVTLRVLDHATEALAVFDRNGRIVFANQAAAVAAGKAAEDLTGRSLAEVYPPLAQSKHFQRVLSDLNGASVGYEARDPRSGRWFLIRASSTDEGVAASATDITEVRSASDQLRLQLGEVQNLYRLAPAGLCALDRDLRFIRVNDSLADLGGRPPADYLGRSIQEMLPDSVVTLNPLFRQVLATGQPVTNIELSLMTRSNSGSRAVTVLASFEPLRNGEEIVGVNAAFQDITERKKSETALSESTQRLRMALDAARMGTWEFDLTRRVVTYGRNESQLLSLPSGGYVSLDEYLGRIQPEYRDGLVEAIASRTPDDPMFEFDFEVDIPEGGTRWIRNIGRAEFDTNGRPSAAVGISVDHTERQIWSAQIESANRQLQAVIEASPLAIILIGPDSTIGLWNARATDVLGHSREEADAELASGNDDPDSLPFLLRKYAGREALGDEHLCRTRRGERLILSVYSRPILPSHGEMLGTLLVVVDVTERRKAEDRLRVLNEASQVLSESLAYETTLGEVARIVAPRFADWCAIDIVRGLDLERLAVAHIDPSKVELAHRLRADYPEDPLHPSLVRQVIETGEPAMVPVITEEMVRGAARDAEHLRLIQALGFTAMVVVPLVSRGRTYGAMSFVWAESQHRYTREDVDLALELGRRAGIAIDNARLFEESQDDLRRRAQAETEIRRLNRELESMVEQRTRQLRQAVDDLEGFCYSVSHDLRAPMRAISGNARIILEDYSGRLDEAGKHSLDRIATAATKMGRLIDDLLQFSRLGRAALHRQKVDLSSMAETIVAGLRADSELMVDVRIETGMEAIADPEMLRMALTNLIENAWKYSSRSPNPRIEIGSVENGDEKAFFVKDNGIGFDMKYVDKIFQPFERLHRDSEYPGTGIGLANVHRVVSRHGGRVWADAEIGKGATFYFTLPDEVTDANPVATNVPPYLG